MECEAQEIFEDKDFLSAFYYYYEIWENFNFFGLPNGRGWLNEPRWMIEFLKSFEKAFKIFQSRKT